ncbi:hypothetical protein GCM10007979_01820 [Nocardioides albus]|nr:hypothetical protein GCM10007979_01820 [Nocardioides albus]
MFAIAAVGGSGQLGSGQETLTKVPFLDNRRKHWEATGLKQNILWTRALSEDACGQFTGSSPESGLPSSPSWR